MHRNISPVNTLPHGGQIKRLVRKKAGLRAEREAHTPSITFRHLPQEGCRKPVLGVCGERSVGEDFEREGVQLIMGVPDPEVTRTKPYTVDILCI